MKAVQDYKEWSISTEVDLGAIDRPPNVQSILGAAFVEEDWIPLFLEGAEPDADLFDLHNRVDDLAKRICGRLRIDVSVSLFAVGSLNYRTYMQFQTVADIICNGRITSDC